MTMTETSGSLLESTRKGKNLHIAQVSKVTRISVRYLEALERDALDELPSPVHARGFLRTYAEFLGLDPGQLPGFSNGISQVDAIPNGPGSVDEGISEPLKEDRPSQTLTPQETTEVPVDSPGSASDQDEDWSEETDLNQPDQPAREGESARIFASIGSQLKSQRELLGISLLEVEKQSHVRKHYLEAIESGHFQRLPTSVQARGMLSNYARFLEFDVDSILLKYADGLQAQRRERTIEQADQQNAVRKPGQRFRLLGKYLSIDILFGGGLILLLIIFAFWGTGKVIDLYKSPEGAGNAASISDVIMTPLGTLSAGTQASPQPATESTPTGLTQVTGGTSSIPTNGQGQVQLYVVVLQSTYLRVIVDGKVAFEGRVAPGTAYPFNGYSQVEVLTGNASALQIYFNQTDLGVMGIFGEVIDRIYTPNGVLMPTATITPTITISPTPTKTPRVTATATPSATSTPFYLPTP